MVAQLHKLVKNKTCATMRNFMQPKKKEKEPKRKKRDCLNFQHPCFVCSGLTAFGSRPAQRLKP